MKVFLTAVRETEQVSLVRAHASFSKHHELVSAPASSDLILFFGGSALEPNLLLDDEVYQTFPDRCAVYSEEDHYLPLLPGIYCSARTGEHTRIGRVFTYAYVSRNGKHKNHYMGETTSEKPIGAAAPKQYLFTFQGGSTSLLRKRLFNLKFERNDVFIENTSTYLHWDNSQPDRLERQKHYAETIGASHFVLCPRGAGTGSIRLFEVMAAGVAPVLLSDDYDLPPGPEWNGFLLRVPERDLHRLPAILEPQVETARERGRLARQAFERHFSIEHEFDQIVELGARALRHAPPAELQFRRRQRAMIRRFEFVAKTRERLRSAVLKTIQKLHLKNPYQMNR